jgi:hypothetical protein
MGTGMGDLSGPKRVTARFRTLIEAYKGAAGQNATEAARIAGYSDPEKVGWRLKRRFPEVFARAEQEVRDALIVQREEVQQRLADLVRNPKHRDHYKALELAAKMHGLLSEKVNVTIERPAINAQLDELIKAMMASRATQKGLEIDVKEIPLLTASSQQPDEK